MICHYEIGSIAIEGLIENGLAKDTVLGERHQFARRLRTVLYFSTDG